MRTPRTFLNLASCAALWAVALAPGTLPARADKPPRPNILYVMSDDHAAHAIGAYGSRLAKLNPTPVIDTLARDGILLTNVFCTNSICVPSRATIMTGQYSHVNGAIDLGGRLAGEHHYLAIEMRRAGYQTAMIGKWHLHDEPNFDYYKVLPGQGKYFDPTFHEKGRGDWPRNTVQMKGHSSDCITDSTLAWLASRDRSRPFFLMHHFKAPHDMFENAPRYEGYLADVEIPEPENLYRQERFGSIATRGDHDELLPFIGTSIGRRHAFRNYARNWARDASLSDDQARHQAYQTYLKRYLRCVKGVDDNLKRILDLLKSEGVLDDTVICYTGDQGMMLGEHDYQDKRWMYQESHRMPFLVRYPRAIKPATRSDAIIENTDFAPMLLDFAGAATPAQMQGRSFRPILETAKEPPDWKQAAYYRYWMHLAHHWNPAHIGIRTKQYKLIFYYGCDTQGQNRTPPGWELYDLRKDPHEVVNLYDDPACRQTVIELKKKLAELRAANGDTDEKYPAVKAIIDEFWDYDDKARAKAVEISHDYARRCRERQAGRDKTPRDKTPRDKAGRDGRVKPAAGDWIQAAASDAPLKEYKGLPEVSRDAAYRVSHPGPGAFNLDNAFLTSGRDGREKPHAFHSDQADQPYVVLKLAAPAAVRYVKIVNRRNGFQDRAKGLTLWLSSDAKDWQKAWQADAVQDEWTVDLGREIPCAYIKLGLPARGTLHLYKITAFGKTVAGS